MKKLLHTLSELLSLMFGLDCDARRQAVDAGLCDFSGQGRDKYGR